MSLYKLSFSLDNSSRLIEVLSWLVVFDTSELSELGNCSTLVSLTDSGSEELFSVVYGFSFSSLSSSSNSAILASILFTKSSTLKLLSVPTGS